jgi:hypothetical protein
MYEKPLLYDVAFSYRAIRFSGAFDVAERHGAFLLDAPLDATPASWRMISVLGAR